MVSADQLAHTYERYVSVLTVHYGTGHWRGEVAAVRSFMAWIESCWRDDAPPEPVARPDAVSFGGGRAGVRWYEVGATVFGYQTDLEGCYEVPVIDAPPTLGPRPLALARLI